MQNVLMKVINTVKSLNNTYYQMKIYVNIPIVNSKENEFILDQVIKTNRMFIPYLHNILFKVCIHI